MRSLGPINNLEKFISPYPTKKEVKFPLFYYQKLWIRIKILNKNLFSFKSFFYYRNLVKHPVCIYVKTFDVFLKVLCWPSSSYPGYRDFFYYISKIFSDLCSSTSRALSSTKNKNMSYRGYFHTYCTDFASAILKTYVCDTHGLKTECFERVSLTIPI